jgi:hypothetical protein
MGKNFIFLGILIWAAHSMAGSKFVVKQPHMDHENYKVEKPVVEKEGRKIAGQKKKKQAWKKEESTTETDSEVRYWQYQE